MYCIKERVAWDYYYIKIVKCYLCLALNHQMESLRYHAEIWKLWGACDVCECERRINAFVVQTIRHYFRAYSYSLCQDQRFNCENGDLRTYKRKSDVERARPRQFKVRIQSAKMTMAASSAESAAAAPVAASAIPAGQRRERQRDSARLARANVWARRRRGGEHFSWTVAFE